MNKRERQQQQQMRDNLREQGLSHDEIDRLRRIAMTLHRWSELECGDERGNAIERDETTGKPYLTFPSYSRSNGYRGRAPVADREGGALKRLAAIMAAHPPLTAYHQTDPRGAALYILRPGDVPEGKDADGYYSRGISVW